jgi:plasmid stabilization system protein ParE
VSVPVVVDEEADRELEAARDWYESQRAGLGNDLILAIDAAIASIGHVPALPVPHVAPTLNVKRIMVRRFPYAVVFRETAQEVRILAFAHAKRRPGYWRLR